MYIYLEDFQLLFKTFSMTFWYGTPFLKVRTIYPQGQNYVVIGSVKVKTSYFDEKSMENCLLSVSAKVRTMYYSSSKLCISGISSMSELCMLKVRNTYFGRLLSVENNKEELAHGATPEITLLNIYKAFLPETPLSRQCFSPSHSILIHHSAL